MALTEIQRSICRVIAENRISSGESYVAGPAALNELIQAPRLSRDVDLSSTTQNKLFRAAGMPIADSWRITAFM